jgi:hypothetical protein
VVIGALSLLVLAPAAAFAQTTNPDYPSPSVSTTIPTGGTVSGVSVQAAQTSTSSGTLPFTGGNIALLVGLGLVATVGGVILVRFGRRAGVAS